MPLPHYIHVMFVLTPFITGPLWLKFVDAELLAVDLYIAPVDDVGDS